VLHLAVCSLAPAKEATIVHNLFRSAALEARSVLGPQKVQRALLLKQKTSNKETTKQKKKKLLCVTRIAVVNKRDYVCVWIWPIVHHRAIPLLVLHVLRLYFVAHAVKGHSNGDGAEEKNKQQNCVFFTCAGRVLE
jgi:hypothetical protein